MSVWSVLLWIVIIIAVLVGLYFIQDCDFTLAWKLYFGNKPGSLSGKVVWVTGCSSGIGEALAYELAAAGCRLILSARRENILQEVKKKCLEQSNGKLTSEDILVQPVDLLAFDTHRDIAETVIKYYKKIDVLVNNAGRSQRSVIMDTDLAVDRQVLEVDTLGPISLTKAVLPHMISGDGGRIILTSSVAGKYPAPGSASYTAAKHALQGFFDTLRIECYPYNIGVTLACPGPVFSDALLHAFTSKDGEKLNVPMDKAWKRMTAQRCAQLMVTAAANHLDEVWLSPHPELLYCYLFQYLPYFATKIAVRAGQYRANKVKTGIANLH